MLTEWNKHVHVAIPYLVYFVMYQCSSVINHQIRELYQFQFPLSHCLYLFFFPLKYFLVTLSSCRLFLFFSSLKMLLSDNHNYRIVDPLQPSRIRFILQHRTSWAQMNWSPLSWEWEIGSAGLLKGISVISLVQHGHLGASSLRTLSDNCTLPLDRLLFHCTGAMSLTRAISYISMEFYNKLFNQLNI